MACNQLRLSRTGKMTIMNHRHMALAYIMMFIPIAIIGACPASIHGQQLAPQTAEALTLEQAVDTALQHNRLVANAAIEVGKSENRADATRTRRLPQFNLYMLGSQLLAPIDFKFPEGAFGSFPGLGPIPGRDTVISSPLRPAALIFGQVIQPLTQQFRLKVNIETLETGVALALEQARQEQHRVINEVKHAYYGMIQTEAGVRSTEESLKLYRELDRLTEEYVTQKVALKSEHLEVKTRLAKAEYQMLTLSNLLATQKEQLNSLLGRDIRTEFTVRPVPEVTGLESDLEAARKFSLEHRPEIRESELRLKQGELDRRAKKLESIPDVSLSLSYLAPLNYSDLIPRTVATFGVVLNWEVFDWGRKKIELAEKDRTLAQARNGLLETRNMVLIDVGAKFRKLQETNQLLRIAALAHETAAENLRIVTNKYNVRVSLLKDVLQSQTALEDVNYQYMQALLSFWTAKADFESALGSDR
jgi:outer membrane protein